MSLMKCSTKKPGSKLLAMIRGPKFVSDQLPAAPPADRLEHRLQVEPGLVAVEQRLADADHVRGDQDLVDHLGVLAGARAALVDDRLAHRLEAAGGTRSTTSLSPPIMIDSAAFRAPTSPPETGASTACDALRLAPLRGSRPPATARWSSCRPGRCPPCAPGQRAVGARGTPRARPPGSRRWRRRRRRLRPPPSGVSAQAAPLVEQRLRPCPCVRL